MLFFLLFYAKCNLFGIDFGGERLRVSYLSPGKPVSVILDSDSNRFFKTTLTVIPKRHKVVSMIDRYNIDDFEYSFNNENEVRKNPNTTIRYYNTFLSKVFCKGFLDLLIHRMLNPALSLHANKRFSIAGVFPEVVLHKALLTINETAASYDPPFVAHNIYACVPKFFMQQERKSIRSVSRMLNFTPYIVDQSTVLAYHFAMTHDRKIKNNKKPLKVAFIDVGETNTQLTITQFKGNKNITSKELFYDYNESIGGRDFDIIIYKMLAESTHHKITFSDEYIMLKEANKIKHRLTTDKFVVGQIDCSVTFSYNISRSDFEERMKPFLIGIEDMINSSHTHVDIVHLIGGSSRVPCIQEMIKKAFNVETLATSMNPEDAIAVGGALFGASKSRDYKLMVNVNHKPIDLYKPEFIDSDGAIVSQNTTGKNVYILLKAKKIPFGSLSFGVWGKTDENSYFQKTSDGIWQFKNSTKKTRQSWKYALKEQKDLIEDRDMIKKMTEFSANELENLIITVKNVLRYSDTVYLVSTDKELKYVSMAVNSTDQWFLKQKAYKLNELKYRIQVLKESIGSVMARVQNYETLNSTLDNMTHVFGEIEHTISGEWSIKSKRPSRDKIRSIIRSMVETKLWVKEKQRFQSKLSIKDDPAFKWYELAERIDSVSKEFIETKESLKIVRLDRRMI